MKNIGFTLLTVIMIIGLGAAGYFAIESLKNPSAYVTDTTEKIGDLHQVSTELETGTELELAPATTPEPVTPPVITDELATNLQKLLDAKTVLKVGSKGPTVGYIQEFMNRYFDKELKIDNDFGKTLEANVKAFQKAVGLPQTGQVGTQGLTKMIEWLGKQ